MVPQRALRCPLCIWLLVCGGCAKPYVQAQPETVSIAPQVGWSCFEASKIRGSKQELVARFTDALRKHGVRPAIADTLPLRIIVGGSRAPAGMGTAAKRAARLYMSVFGISDVQTDSVFPTWYTVTSGVYSAPSDISDMERSGLYEQAYRLTQSVLVTAKLDTLHCGT